MQDRMWHVCGHLSVCTVNQWGLGILHGKCGVCGPHPAVPQAKPQIKPSSAPCPRQSLCSPVLGAFSRAAFAPTSFSFSLRGAALSNLGHQPGLVLPGRARISQPGQSTPPCPGRRWICQQRCWGGRSLLWEYIPSHCTQQFPVQWCKRWEFVRYKIAGPGLRAGRRAV